MIGYQRLLNHAEPCLAQPMAEGFGAYKESREGVQSIEMYGKSQA